MNVLTNSYHDTEAHTRLTDDQLEALSYRVYSNTATSAEVATMKRIKRGLCPSRDCTCGDEFGRRR